MKKLHKYRLIKFISFLFTSLLFSQSDFSFKNISVQDGLSESTVKVILEDHNGFIYFGTENGLDIYNGYEFKNYHMDAFDDNSMLGNKISYLYEDSKGMIWIGTELGISKYDPILNEFSRPINIDSFTHDEEGKEIWSPEPINIVDDENGDIWFNIAVGYLFHYSDNSGLTVVGLDNDGTKDSHPFNKNNFKITKLLKDNNNIVWFGTRTITGYDSVQQETKYNYGLYYTIDGIDGIKPFMINGSGFVHKVNVFEQGKDNIVWVGTDQGLFELVDNPSGKVNIYKKEQNKNSIVSNQINDLGWDRKNEKLWIATKDGLSCYFPKQKIFYNIQEGPFANSIIENDIKELLVAERSNRIWYTTENYSGLNCLNIDENGSQDTSVIHFEHNPIDPSSIADNNINAFIEDKSGHIWIGTDQNGISFNSIFRPKFISYQYDQENEWGLKNNKIYSITADTNHMIWVATGYGLEYLYPDGYREYDFEESVLNVNAIMDIALDGDRYLWAATDKGIIRIEKESDNTDPEVEQIFSDDIVYDLIITDNGRLIAGTHEMGLVVIDTMKMEIDHDYEHLFGDDYDWGVDGVWNEGPIRVVYQVVDGDIWLGTDHNGLFKIPAGLAKSWFSNRINYKYDPEIPKGLSSSTITCIAQDQNGELWIGTNNGLNKYEKDADNFIHYFVNDGLPSNYITGIVSDEKNNLWISSKKGISFFSKQSKIFTNYGFIDGTGNIDFHRNSYTNSNDGNIYFGGPNGITKVNPLDLRYNDYQPPCIITSVKKTSLDDKIIEIFDYNTNRNNQSDLPMIMIDHRVKSFSVDFVALNYHQTMKNQYRYKLEPFDRDWIDSRGSRFASYNNLGRKTYMFVVQGSNDDGLWSKPARLNVKFIPHPLLSYWAFSIYALITIIGFFIFIRHRMKKQKSQLEEERRVKEMEQAREFQMSLIPQTPPKHPDYDFALHMKTSTEVGGDYYDFFPQEDGSIYVVCGDATGHGLNAGMMVSITKAGLHGSDFDTPANTTTRLNKTIKAINLGTTRMSLNMVKIHNGSFDFTSAGMPPAYLYSNITGSVEEILVPGLPLGSMKMAEFDLQSFNLDTGDALVLISDGLPECVNHDGEMLDYEPVKDCIKNNGNKTAQEIIDSLITLGDNWMSGLMNEDDITLVVIKKK